MIAKYLCRSLPPSFEADDLVQAAVLAVMDQSARYSPDRGPFWPFVKHRAYGAMLDLVRREWKKHIAGTFHVEHNHERQLEVGYTERGLNETLCSRDPNPESAILAKESTHLMVSRLPAPEKRYVRLRLKGFTRDEISGILNVTPRRVNQIKQSARNRMKELAA